MEIRIADLNDLTRAASEFLQIIGDHKIFPFKAEMGAGKTTFILSLLKQLGVEHAEGSPTYSLVNTYESPIYGSIYHFDLYRLKDEQEAFDIGIEEMIYGDSICFIEWPEKISDLLPDEAIWSYIRKNDDDSRTITIDL